jgi:CheY-specific phosphatase CheX
MPAEARVEIHASDLAQIVQSVFDTMLTMRTVESETAWYPGSDRVTARVDLSGAWTGAVLLECGRGQACRFASRFLSVDPPDSVDDVVRAALSELANMIGGNLKCVMTPGIQLSMPSVVDGSDSSMLFRGLELRERVALDSAEGVFWVTVVAAKPLQPS